MNKIKENKKLIKEFPFLEPRNAFTGEPIEDYDYSYTNLDQMPRGWRIGFGLEFCNELKKALGKNVNSYRVTQIKEKYGSLRWYDTGNTKEGYKVIDKYEKISEKTCFFCGKTTEDNSNSHYAMPLCKECQKARNNKPQ